MIHGIQPIVVPTKKSTHPIPLRATSERYGYLHPPSNLPGTLQPTFLLIYDWDSDGGAQSANNASIVGKDGSVRLTVLPEAIEVDPRPGTLTFRFAL